MQADLCAATLIGDRKAVSADSKLATVHHGKADAAGPGDDNASVAPAMGTEARNHCIVGINEGAKRMWPLHQFLKRALAADPGETHASVHLRQGRGGQAGIRGGCKACTDQCGKRTVDAQPCRCGTCHACTEITASVILDPCAAVRSTAVD